MKKTLYILVTVMIFLFFISSKKIESKELKSNQAQLIDSYYAEKTDFNTINTEEIDDTKNLILVNKNYKINTSVAVDDVFGEIPILTAGIKMNPIVLSKIKNLFNDAEKIGYPDFLVTSGYRTSEEQKKLYNKAKDKTFVQKPSHSEHQTGLAVDIGYKGIKTKNFDSTEQGKWIIENAWKYGFILRYPEDKQDITNINYEPWHFRYVGIPHAYFCFKNNLCLEEYIDYLKTNKSCVVSIDNNIYNIYYSKADNGIIKTPSAKNFNVSSDNTGGYIFTVKE